MKNFQILEKKFFRFIFFSFNIFYFVYVITAA